MYSQLGNIVFEGLTSFESFSRQDNTTYAQHDLVTGKPRLQPIANDLEELTITLKLRAEFCDPAFSIRQLKDAKDSFEVMPLVTGAGRYIGDYVITELGEAHNVMFADGAIIEATVNLTLKEYVTPDKLLQAQQSARKRAFAVGDRTPVNTGLKTDTTIPQDAAFDMSAINSETKGIDTKVINYANNPSQQHAIAGSIVKSLDNIQTRLNDFNKQVQELETRYNPADMLAAALSVKNAVTNFNFPVTSLAGLQLSNLQLQSALLGLKQVATILNYNVITRRA